jgi:hypothetical protein
VGGQLIGDEPVTERRVIVVDIDVGGKVKDQRGLAGTVHVLPVRTRSSQAKSQPIWAVPT